MVLAASSASISTGQSAEDLRTKLADRYENMQAMSASFVQIANSDFMDSPERFSGTMIFSGPKYRIQTGAQTIVTDGATLWIHNRGERQVIINDFVDDETSFSLTTFLRQFGKDYDAVLDGSEIREGVQHDILKLRPLDDFSQFRTVRMDVRRSDTIVTYLEVVDLNDVLMTFELSEIIVNPTVPAGTFSFAVPADLEIIDLRN